MHDNVTKITLVILKLVNVTTYSHQFPKLTSLFLQFSPRFVVSSSVGDFPLLLAHLRRLRIAMQVVLQATIESLLAT